MALYGYFCYLMSDKKEDSVVKEMTGRLTGWKKGLVRKYTQNPWNISLGTRDFFWGSFYLVLGNTQDMFICDTVLGLDSSESKKVSRDASDFILGVNAMRKCYITGMGEDGIKCTFSNFWEKLPKGYMPGGINNQNGDIISNFPIKSYCDESVDWFTNENAIYWNAVMVFNTAMNS